MGNQTKLSGLCMAYPGSMDTPPALLHEVWQRTPPEAQASIRNSSRPPSSDPGIHVRRDTL